MLCESVRVHVCVRQISNQTDVKISSMGANTVSPKAKNDLSSVSTKGAKVREEHNNTTHTQKKCKILSDVNLKNKVMISEDSERAILHSAGRDREHNTAQHSTAHGDHERVGIEHSGTEQATPGVASLQHEMPEGGPQGPLPLIPGDVASMRRSKVTVTYERQMLKRLRHTEKIKQCTEKQKIVRRRSKHHGTKSSLSDSTYL